MNTKHRTTSQRRLRSARFLALAAAPSVVLHLVIGPVIANAAVFPVTPGATADLPDAIPGNGVCLTAAGNCTLRAAVQEANAFAGSDRIEVPAGTYLLTIPGAEEESAVSGDLDLTESVDLVGVGPGEKVVDGNGLDRVFDIHAGVHARIEGLTVRGGNADAATSPGHVGGGLLVRGAANLDLASCSVVDNRANAGGGLYAQSGSTASILDCSLRDNLAADLGFMLAVGSAVLSEGDTDLDRCEVSGNVAALAGGAVLSRDAVALSVRNTTISGNSDIGLGSEDAELDVVNVTLVGNGSIGLSVVTAAAHPLTVRNSIIYGHGAGDCSIVGVPAGNLDFAGEHNLSGDGSCPNDGGVVDLPGMNPLLGSLLAAGGATHAHVPLVGSPVIDAGDDDRCEPDDQRGASRPLDGDGVGGATCDIGAVETLPCIGTADRLVTGEVITAPAEFAGCYTVTAGPAVEVMSGGDLVLRARNGVILRDDFSASGGDLSVILDPAAASGVTLP